MQLFSSTFQQNKHFSAGLSAKSGAAPANTNVQIHGSRRKSELHKMSMARSAKIRKHSYAYKT